MQLEMAISKDDYDKGRGFTWVKAITERELIQHISARIRAEGEESGRILRPLERWVLMSEGVTTPVEPEHSCPYIDEVISLIDKLAKLAKEEREAEILKDIIGEHLEDLRQVNHCLRAFSNCVK